MQACFPKGSPECWRDILATGVGKEAEVERIREATRTGRQLGSPDVVRDVELKIERSLERGKAGRTPRYAPDKIAAVYFYQWKWEMSAPRI